MTSCPFAWQPSHRHKMVLFTHPAAPRTLDSNCSTPHTSTPHQSGKYAPPIPISTDSAYPVSTSREIAVDHELPMPERPGILSEMPNRLPSGAARLAGTVGNAGRLWEGRSIQVGGQEEDRIRPQVLRTVHRPDEPSSYEKYCKSSHKHISIPMNTSHIQFLKRYAKALAQQEHATAGLDDEGDSLVETGALEDAAEQLVLDSCEVGIKRLVVVLVEVDKVMLSDEEVADGVVSVELVSSFSIEDIDMGLIAVVVGRGFKVVDQHGNELFPTVIDVGPSLLIEMGSMVYICVVTRAMGYRNRSLDIFMMVISEGSGRDKIGTYMTVNLFLLDRRHPGTTIESAENLVVERIHPSEDETAIIGIPGVMFTSGDSYRYFGHVGSGKISRAQARVGGKLTGMVE
ncbi:hypothetical protein F5146DRAFT_1002589 [Armillaria mellea]|nr:hypothetical protein F5146DRAFT_1002589 [Armillaria mellea]